MLDDFQKFLRKARKKNGDKLLENTIDQYVYFAKEYYKEIEELKENSDELLEFMNKIIVKRPSIGLYSSFRLILLFLGFDKKSNEINNLNPPEKLANSFTSIRVLQSKILSKGELARLFNESNDEEKLIFSFLYDTGVRRHELLNIKFSDITFIDKTKDKTNIYAEVNILGKGQKARTVYLSKIAHDLLLRLREGYDTTDKVFQFYKTKKKLYRKQQDHLYYLITQKIKKVLGRHITPHCFRHTKLQHLADNGCPVLQIANLAGHSNIQTTMVYIEASNYIGKKGYEQFSQSIIEEEE